METSAVGGGGYFRRARAGLSMAGAMLLLALTLTLTGAVPASAASCVPGPGANLSSCNLSKANLYGVNLTGANLAKANLTDANLTNANLTNANLTRATGTGTDLQGALISNAILTDATLKNALLDGASLEGSSLAGANFSGSDLTGLVSGTDSGGGVLPSNWSLVGGYLVGPGANLTNAALANVDLSTANLTGANLTGADVDSSSLGGAILTGVISDGLIGTPISLPATWSVVNGYLIGPDAFLYGADLGGADLTGVDAAGANLEGAVLTGATLTNANLSNVDAISATLCGSDLSGTDLAGADLAGVTSGGITGTPSALPAATPSNWQLVDGYLVGPYSDLADATLAGADLTDSNLRSTNLTDADMTGSNLTDSSIRYTDLEGTNLTNAILTDVTSSGIAGTPEALPPGWELVSGVLEMTTIPPLSRRSATRISSAAAGSSAAGRPAAPGPSAMAGPRTPSSSKASSSPPAVTTPQRGIDVYAPDVCQTAAAWQQNATNEMRGIKSLGANSVSIAFPFYTTSPTSNSLFGADLCDNPESPLPPLQSPTPARLAVLVRAAESVGLQVMIRPLMEQSNLYILGDWRGDIDPTNPTAWFTSYESFLKPYLEMAQANNVAIFSISSELSSLSTEKAWTPTIAFVHSLYTGQLVFDSSWNFDSGEVHQGTAVALDAYPPLAQSNTATVAQLLAGWNDYLKVQPLPAAATHVTFDEVGIAAADGAYADPNIPPATVTFNQTIQANWFTAACEFVKQHKLEGMYFWGQQLSLNLGNLITQPNPQQVSELQPAAQAAIRKCFASK